MIRKQVSSIVDKLAKYRAGPDCGENAVRHMLKTLAAVSLSWLLVDK